MDTVIDSKILYYAYLSGARNVMANKNILNRINVFPVADGDTGSNLFSTMNSIINESKESDSIKNTLESIANASLSGARGNSGIIFAQYISGLSMEIEHENYLSINNFVIASNNAVKYAYGAIDEPIEGTMITVIKDWANSLKELHNKTKDFPELLLHSYKRLKTSLANTQNQLAVLKKAKVVDSGAKGFTLFIKGFLDFIINGKEHIDLVNPEIEEEIEFEVPDDLHIETKYRYCTEAMIAGENLDQNEIKNQLRQYGDSLIVAGNTKKMRIHIHTDLPNRIFEELSDFSQIVSQKVDDMVKENDIKENQKYKIALVTDSIADLPKEYIDENQIHVINLNILFENNNFLDKLTISNKKILEFIDGSTILPTSSQPDYKTIENLFNYLSTYYESIIVITVSKFISGTNNIVSKVAETFKDIKITVIDSKQNSGAQGLLVMKCLEEIKKGVIHDQIVESVNEDIEKSKILVSVKKIDNMVKAGRLSNTAGKIAKRLNLKPIVTINKEGEATLGTVAFSDKGAMKRIISHAKKVIKKKGIKRYSIVHVDNLETAREYSKIFEKLIGKKAEYIDEVSSIVAISAGQGAIAFSYITN